MLSNKLFSEHTSEPTAIFSIKLDDPEDWPPFAGRLFTPYCSCNGVTVTMTALQQLPSFQFQCVLLSWESAKNVTAVAVACSERNLEPDCILLDSHWEGVLDQRRCGPLYTQLGFHGDTTDMPVGTGSCHLVSRSYCIPFVLARELEASSLVSSIYLVILSSGTFFLLLFSKQQIAVILMYKFQ